MLKLMPPLMMTHSFHIHIHSKIVKIAVKPLMSVLKFANTVTAEFLRHYAIRAKANARVMLKNVWFEGNNDHLYYLHIHQNYYLQHFTILQFI